MKKLLIGIMICVLACAACALAFADDTASGRVLEAGKDYYFQTLKKLTKVPTIDAFSVMQGGGRDEKYAYYAMVRRDVETKIFKYDLETWKCVAVSEPLLLGHCNDLAYDPVNHRLAVARVYAPYISFIDPETLTVTDKERTLIYVHRLAYVPDESELVTASNYTYMLYNADNYKKAIGYFDCQGYHYTTQGMTVDSSYIYDIRWDDSLYEQSLTDKTVQCDYIVIHDLAGNFIGNFPVYGLEGEPENIFILDNGQFVIGCNGSDSAYLVEMRER